MAALLHTLETEFDTVLIDSPPLLPVTDGALLAKLARGALLLVASGRTRKNEVAASVSTLERVDAHLAGIVMTMVPTHGPDAYGYGRYGYGAYGAKTPSPATVALGPVAGTSRAAHRPT
jgi:Mrp family chromosome partitioning ATPase